MQAKRIATDGVLSATTTTLVHFITNFLNYIDPSKTNKLSVALKFPSIMNSIMNESPLSMEEDLTVPLSSPVFPSQGTQEKAKRRRKRKKKADGEIKRKMLSEEQARFLEMSFIRERRLGAARKEQLAIDAGIEPKRVAVWFQNRRARWKNKMMEEEYAKLKAEFDSTLVIKCQLEAEVLKMREELSEAHREIKKLSSCDREGSFGNNGNDQLVSCTPLSFAEISQPLLADIAQQETYAFECMNDYFGYVNMWDWEM